MVVVANDGATTSVWKHGIHNCGLVLKQLHTYLVNRTTCLKWKQLCPPTVTYPIQTENLNVTENTLDIHFPPLICKGLFDNFQMNDNREMLHAIIWVNTCKIFEMSLHQNISNTGNTRASNVNPTYDGYEGVMWLTFHCTCVIKCSTFFCHLVF